MSEQASSSKKHNNNLKSKRPPLTHFLCLPLVNAVSLPQFESSLAAFKASIPPAFPAKPDQSKQSQQLLIPNDAIRPVGTLHLTLGVMSLPTTERLDEALQFFRSLDLVDLLHEAEERASQRASQKNKGEGGFSTVGEPPNSASQDSPRPFTISLESLHALPRARAATVLHASPVDPTSRLYPFCELLRSKFLEAGYIQPDYQKPRKVNKKNEKAQANQERPDASAPAREDPGLLEELPTAVAEETAEQSRPPVRTSPLEQQACEKEERKIRPLLLHATIVNTIYVRGRKQNTGSRGKKGRGNDRFTIDARDILSHHENFYRDGDRRIPRVSGVIAAKNRQNSTGNADGNYDSNGHSQEGEGKYQDTAARENKGKQAGHPFVWARDFPIEAISICEMGAKKLDPEADESGINARLGQKYMPVAERSLVF
ncbi:hypothetical protein BJY04DRAFT_213042 [Aspergillus karnatakaensis]|uniref:uncharacterized protein n=1 Tax=Aspergillus karnatakaensis TaxID=1810916 RepID=UPI003CCCE6D0